MVKGARKTQAVSRYQPLADYLASRSENELSLTFAQIETIIGGALPTSAQVVSTYWTDVPPGMGRLWCAVGWKARLNRRNQSVQFSLDSEDGLGVE